MSIIDDYLTDTAYRVEKGNWTLYDDVPTSSPLTLSTAPTVSFRCRVTLATSAGHTDCAGTITIGSETLTFSATGIKTTTVALSSKPTITYANLDCHILIEAITSSGADIIQETQVAIDCRFNNTQKMFQNSLGEWDTSQAIAYINDSSMDLGDTFSHGNYDYLISQLTSHEDLDNTEAFRKLWLTGKTPAPANRVTISEIQVYDLEVGWDYGTGADQEIAIALVGEYTLGLEDALGNGVTFTGVSTDIDHFHVTATGGKKFRWMVTLD